MKNKKYLYLLIIVLFLGLLSFSGPILFEVNYSKNGIYRLNSSSKLKLDTTIVKSMLQNKTLCLKIIGHSNSVECDVKDSTLSCKRAKKAMKYILSKGIAEDRVKCEGVGGSRSYTKELGGGDDVENRNRRTVFKLYFKE